jgi:hypothetical protein
LQKKANSVFLWVVLVCRTQIDGFTAYDNAEKLQARVDELPLELEDLFRHKFQRIPPRFLHQTAKLLHICNSGRLLQISDRISTLALAWAYQEELDMTGLDTFKRHSPEENGRKCAMLEGSLRSRCMGLLEVYTNSELLRSASAGGLIDSFVDSIHGTVFEFLNISGVWKMECLQVGENSFDDTVVLSHLSYCLIFLQQETISKKGDFA